MDFFPVISENEQRDNKEELENGGGLITLDNLGARIDIFKKVTKFEALLHVAEFAFMLEKQGDKKKKKMKRLVREKKLKKPLRENGFAESNTVSFKKNKDEEGKLLASAIKVQESTKNRNKKMKRRRIYSGKKEKEEEDDQEWEIKPEKKKAKTGSSSRLRKQMPVINENPLPAVPADLPQDFKNKIEEMKGTKVSLVIQKAVTPTDMGQGQCRLSVPKRQTLCEFLTEEEKETIATRNTHLKVKIIEPLNQQVSEINFKQWDMRKPKGNTSSVYVFISSWNSLRDRNNLNVDDIVQLWSFRDEDQQLCFALVRV